MTTDHELDENWYHQGDIDRDPEKVPKLVAAIAILSVVWAPFLGFLAIAFDWV